MTLAFTGAVPSMGAAPPPLDLLLDTHTFLWIALTPARVTGRAHRAITDPANRKRVSVLSFWEIGIKAATGALPQGRDVLGLAALCPAQGIDVDPIDLRAVDLISRLPFPQFNGREHRDPFDRLLAATALTAGLTVVSADPVLDLYGVRRLWD